MNRTYCCLQHALSDTEEPGETGQAARWAAAELSQQVEAGQPRWCGQETKGSGQ